MGNIDKIVDARGLPCPMPIVRLSQAIAEIEIGQVLEVGATDPSFAPDVTAWCRKTGHELAGIRETEEETKAYVRRTK